MEKVLIAWALLVAIIVFNIHYAFDIYGKGKSMWKLCLHIVLLACFGILNVDLGLFCIRMQFDSVLPVFNIHMVRNKSELTKFHQLQDPGKLHRDKKK